MLINDPPVTSLPPARDDISPNNHVIRLVYSPSIFQVQDRRFHRCDSITSSKATYRSVLWRY